MNDLRVIFVLKDSVCFDDKIGDLRFSLLLRSGFSFGLIGGEISHRWHLRLLLIWPLLRRVLPVLITSLKFHIDGWFFHQLIILMMELIGLYLFELNSQTVIGLLMVIVWGLRHLKYYKFFGKILCIFFFYKYYKTFY